MISLTTSASFCFPKEHLKQSQDTILPVTAVGDGYLLAVADGVGSYVGAKEASMAAVKYLEKLSKSANEINISEIFSEIKNNVSLLSEKDMNLSKAATTLTFCYVNASGARIGHIGDCRLYLKSGNKLIRMTKDHTQHQKLIDEKIFTAKQLKGQPGKNILTTAISSNINMKFDETFIPFSDLPIEDGRISIFIMSDGAHHYWEERPKFSEKTMNNVIRLTSSLQNRIEKKGPVDDYSIVSATLKIE